MKDEKLIQVSTYARQMKKSVQWIYHQIKKGEVEFRQIDKRYFIVVK